MLSYGLAVLGDHCRNCRWPLSRLLWLASSRGACVQHHPVLPVLVFSGLALFIEVGDATAFIPLPCLLRLPVQLLRLLRHLRQHPAICELQTCSSSMVRSPNRLPCPVLSGLRSGVLISGAPQEEPRPLPRRIIAPTKA